MKADIITKDFISDPDVFADVFNYYIYEGNKVIVPEQLMECDSAELALPYGVDGVSIPVQKFRDVQKLCTVKTDGKIAYVLYGAENQTEIHYAMAVKNYLYDALEYAGQVDTAAKAHRKAMKRTREQRAANAKEDNNHPSSGEFLSGFWKEDKLIPSVTLTIYFGCDKWDGPLSLFDMMEVSDSRILSCMDNYHVRLIAPALMTDEEIMRFQSNLREVMLFIKYSKDKEMLQKILKANEERFQDMERRAADVIEVITQIGLHFKEKEMKVNMCQAIQEIREEERQIGELKKARESAVNFYHMGLEVDKIAEGLGYTVETVKQWLNISA